MSAIKNVISAHWPTAVGYLFVFALIWVLTRIEFRRLAKISIATDLIHLLLALVARNLLLPPSDSPAFPPLAQLLFTIELLMAVFVSCRVLDKICRPKPGGETDVDNLSVLDSSIVSPKTGWKTITRHEWQWTLLTDVCFAATFALQMSLRHLTYHA